MADPPKFDVFISYAKKDRPWASKFFEELEAQGVHAWFDEAQLAIGEPWQERMEQALFEAPIVAVVVSPDYLGSSWQAFELGAAVAGNKRIIPIVTQEVGESSLPLILRDRRLLSEASPQAAGKMVAEIVGDMVHPGRVVTE